MERNPKRRASALTLVLGLIALAILLAIFAPEEETLGSYIKLIYIHAAVTWVGLVAFAVSGLLGLLYVIGRFAVRAPERQGLLGALLAWSSAGQLTALLFWTASVSLGSISAYLTWGGQWWIEPRLRVAVFILVLAFAVYQLRGMIADKLLKGALNLGLPVASVVLLATTGKLVHPNNALANSDSFEIKLFAALIALAFFVAGALIMRISASQPEPADPKAELAGVNSA